MKITELFKKKMTFSFEVFPPKIEQPMEPLFETLEHLYRYNPDFISCTYGAGARMSGEILKYARRYTTPAKVLPLLTLPA